MNRATTNVHGICFREGRRLRVRASLDMTALITVVLNLLLFFILGASFTTQFPVTITSAEAEGPIVYEQKDLSITLPYDGGIYLNEEQVTGLDEVARILSEAHSQRPEMTVVIRPDARIESTRLIEVLGLVNSIGIKHCTIAARPSSASARP